MAVTVGALGNQRPYRNRATAPAHQLQVVDEGEGEVVRRLQALRFLEGQ